MSPTLQRPYAPRPSRLRIALASLLASQALVGPACAEDAAAKDRDAVELDAVNVVGTAARGSAPFGVLGARSLQDTPYSVSVVSQQAIEQANPAIVADLFAADASVSNNGQSGYGLFSDRIIVRGLSLSGSNNLVNGVRYYGWGSELPLEAVEQVQLLKGAGGFLYGFGAPGGIVNFITKKPGERPRLDVAAGFESDSIYAAHVDAGGRSGSGVFGYRANLWHEEGESFNGTGVLSDGVSLALDARPSQTLLLSAELVYQDRTSDSTSPAIAVNLFDDLRLPSPIDGRTKLSSDDAYTSSRFTTYIGGLEWRFAEGWNLRLRAGGTKNDYRYPYERLLLRDSAGNYDNRLFDGAHVARYGFAQAIVEGRARTGTLYHHLVAGVDYQDSEDAYGLNAITLQAGSNLHAPVTSRWTYDRSRTVQTWRTAGFLERSLFVSDTVDLSPRWSLLAGLRHSRDEERAWDRRSGRQTSDYRVSANTPTVAVLFKPRDTATLYASYIESLEGGGIVGDDYANAGVQLDALVSRQYELGGKWERGSAAATLAAFRVERGSSYVTADNIFNQDGITRYDGLEAAGQLRLERGWTLGASAVALDARFEQTSDPWLQGRRAEGSARATGTVHAAYDLASVPGLSLRGLLRYQGRTAIHNLASRGVTLYTPSAVLATLGADYRTTVAGRAIDIHAQVDNLFDRTYWSPGSSASTNALSPGRPRTFTLSARLHFL